MNKKTTVISAHAQSMYTLQNNEPLDVKVLNIEFLTIPVVIWTIKNFYLKHEINDKLEAFKSSGLISYWYHKSLNLKLENEQDSPQSLAFRHLSGCFQILLGGYAISAFIFFTEFLRHKCNKSKFVLNNHRSHTQKKLKCQNENIT